uniref:Self-incompatibility-linked fibrinogen-like protein-A n=3 Tax=Ciona intestinalis TaxID=7719 RepID=A0A143RFM0_CIOIN|nr:self-incompatibility-linked fibrinogen-like protein-A [Ciona intestinalis]
MYGIVFYSILIALFKQNLIQAFEKKSQQTITTNFTAGDHYKQLKLIYIVRKLQNVKNFQEKQQTTCSRIRTKHQLELQVDNTTRFKQIARNVVFYQDCKAMYDAGYVESGVYPIWIYKLYKFTHVYCDMDVQAVSNNTGWISIQKRVNGEINFDRGWQNYVDGFGNVRGEYWIGLKHIYALTNQNTTIDWIGSYVTPPRMRIDFVDQDGVSAYAEYKLFKVSGAEQKYRLIAAHLDQATAIPRYVSSPISRNWFSTYDNNHAFSNCHETFHGGWWFSGCGESNLNGPYPQTGDKNSPSNIYWYDWYTVNENNTAFKSVSMKFQY